MEFIGQQLFKANLLLNSVASEFSTFYPELSSIGISSIHFVQGQLFLSGLKDGVDKQYRRLQ